MPCVLLDLLMVSVMLPGSVIKYPPWQRFFIAVFNGRTRIVEENSEIIPRSGFTLTKCSELAANGGDSPYMYGEFHFQLSFVYRHLAFQCSYPLSTLF